MSNESKKVEDSLTKSIDELVTEFILKGDKEDEEKEKKADNPEHPGEDAETRGGEDLIKEKEKDMKEEEKKAEDKKEDEKEEEKKADKEEDKKEDEEKADDEEEKEGKDKDLKDSAMKYSKKSHSIDEDEYAAFQDWKKNEEIKKAKKERDEQVEDIKKSVIEALSDKFVKTAEILKALNESQGEIKESLEKIGVQAFRTRKSVKDLTTIEKGGKESSEDKPLSMQKSKLLNTLSSLCKANKIAIEDVTMFESAGVLTPGVQEALKEFESTKVSDKE